MFNNQELKNLYLLLERTQLTGKESLTCVILMQKIQKLITPEVGGFTSETTGTNEPTE